MRLRVLAFSAASGRIGAVFLVDGLLLDWRFSRKAAKSPNQAAAWAYGLMRDLRSDLVITEERGIECRKGRETRANIAAIADVAERMGLHHTSVQHRQRYANKYDEAMALARMFPDIAPWLPTHRRIWDAEPPNTVYAEALSMAVEVLEETDARPLQEQ